MPVTLPLEVYEALEKGLGKEDARAVVKSIEATISEATEYKWATTKDELLDAIRREFVTKDEFRADIARLEGNVKADIARLEGEIQTVRQEIQTVRQEIQTVRVDLEGKIEKEILRLDRKFTVMFVVLFFTIIFLNQNALEFIFRVLGLIR